MQTRTLFFDVNETLLDLAPLRGPVGEALGGRADLVPLWFSTLLHHSLVTTAGGRYVPFTQVAVAALQVVGRSVSVELSPDQAQAAILPALVQLPAHTDVEPGLKRLRDAGHRLVALTNGAPEGLEAQMEFAGLTDLFDALHSVEPVGKFKPHPEVYAWACRTEGVRPERATMVAAHGWDVAGARWAGLRGIFVARPGRSPWPLAPEPDLIVRDLNDLADRLVQV